MMEPRVSAEKNAEFRGHLLSKESMLHAVDDLIPKWAEEEAAATPDADPAFAGQINRLVSELHRTNVNRVFDHSASEIEKVFVNSLLFGFLSVDPGGIVIGAPCKDAPKLVAEKQENFRAARHVRLMTDVAGRNAKDYIEHLRKDGAMTPEEIAHWEMMTIVEPIMGEAFQIIPQAGFPKLKVNDKSIRVDLLIWVGLRPDVKIVVECDGFEWHRDRETFTSDRQRDRLLQANGYQVIRCSGHEIYHQPVDCGMDLYGRLNEIRSAWKPLPPADPDNHEWSGKP